MKTCVLLSILALSGVAHAQTAPDAATPNAPTPAPFFSDVPRDHWAYAAVQRLASAGIIEGVGAAPAPPKAASLEAPHGVRADNASRVLPHIKLAIGNNAAMRGTFITVSALSQKPLIVLAGTVKNQAQKQLATALARKNAPGYTISNQLRVAR